MKLLIFIAALVLLAGCSSSPDKAIQKRWKAVDARGNDRIKAKYKRLLEKHSTEMEFKDGKFNAYQDGAIQGSADYTMASDGKSIVVMTNGNPEMTIKIISLSGDQLEAIMDGFMSYRDTVIYKAQ
jgi:hydroxyethylthiazole kinase-like sugar kinase family protein